MNNSQYALTTEILAENYDEVARLINQGVELNSQDQYGFPPLTQAVIKENIALVKLLLENRAKPDTRDIAGSSALSWAANNNQFKICELLLKYGASPNLYDTSGQPILANVRLRQQQELITLLVEHGANIEFAKDYNNAKLIGHRFELTGKADIANAAGKLVEIKFEGFTTEFTLGLIRQSLTEFHNSHIGKNFSTHFTKIQKIIAQLELAQNFIPPLYKQRQKEHADKITPLLQNNFLIIPVTYHGHAISFVKFGDLLARCDRGVNNFADTIIIYRARNFYRLNGQLIKQLIYEHNTKQFINDELREILSLEPITSLPTRSQISGNCSWANIEAGVIAALFMLNYYYANKEDKSQITMLKQETMAFYESWVEWDKDQSLDHCIEDFNNAKELVRRASKAAIMANILFQRCRSTNKNEVKRAKKILSILTLDNYKYILKSYVDVYCNSAASHINEQFTTLLKLCGLDLTTLTLKQEILEPVMQEYRAGIETTTLLHRAAAQGNLTTIKAMFANNKNLDVDALDPTGSSALIYAALNGHFAILMYLIEEQLANHQLLNDKGGSALKYAQHNRHQEIINYLKNLQSNHK